MNALPDWLELFAGLPEWRQRQMLRAMPDRLARRFSEEWSWQAHDGQSEPGGDWRVWLMLAGRGFGKTRAGAEWVSERARACPNARIALVGATLDDVAKVMVEGESGLLAVARSGERPRWSPSRLTLEFASGASAFAYSAERPDKLRGPQHHFAWCDELAKWSNAQGCWDNLRLGMRLGARPRIVVTTTPQPVAMLKRLIDAKDSAVTGGRTVDNPHLPEDFLIAMAEQYGGTRLGRQELDGTYLEEAEGALWSRATIEACRVGPDAERGLARVVVGVDPPAGICRDACGIVVAGLGRDGLAYVLADATVHGASPEGWAAAVVRAAEAWGADRVIAEANQGGEMVGSVLRAVEKHLPVKLRHARDAKGKRAEPVAALFETGRARFAGSFGELEDQLVGLMPGGGYDGPGRSPDRADAMVWAIAELMLGRSSVPRVRAL